jgi:hypothetical protein
MKKKGKKVKYNFLALNCVIFVFYPDFLLGPSIDVNWIQKLQLTQIPWQGISSLIKHYN